MVTKSWFQGHLVFVAPLVLYGMCRLVFHTKHFTISVNQSIIYLLITHRAVKQHEHQDETSRTARHQVHLWLPYKTQKISNTDVKQVQMSEMKAIK